MESDMSFGDRLGDQYKLSCEIYGIYPDLKLWRQFRSGEVSLNISDLKTSDLEVLCHALSQPLTPVMIEIKSSPISEDSRKKSGHGKEIRKLLQALSETLKVSRTLFTMKFVNIFVPAAPLSLFAQGLALTKRLRSLTFVNCRFGKNVIERICLSLKNSTCLSLLTFDNCQINPKHLKYISSLIMHQSLNRTSLLWKHSLRSRHPDKENVSGLTHLVLNNNPLIGDEGLTVLATSLADDLWLKGIELENCGISSTSLDIIVNLFKKNKSLECFSLQNNPFFDSGSLLKVEELLSKKSSYKPPSIKRHYFYKTNLLKEKTSTVENRKIFRNIDLEETLRSKVDIPQELNKLRPGMPWRIEGRIIERNEKLPVGTLCSILGELNKPKLKEKMKKNVEVSNLGISIQNIRNVIKFYKSQCKAESKKRLLAERKMKYLQKKLEHYKELYSDSYVVDGETVSHIEQCFYNFHKFLDKLKRIGYVELKDVSEELTEISLDMSSIPGTKQKSLHKVNSVKKSNSSSSETHKSPHEIRKTIEKVKINKSEHKHKIISRKSKSSVSSLSGTEEKSQSDIKSKDECSQKGSNEKQSSRSSSYSHEFEASENSSSSSTEVNSIVNKSAEKVSSSRSVSKSSSHKNSKKESSYSQSNSASSRKSSSKITDKSSGERVSSDLDVKSIDENKRSGEPYNSDYSCGSHSSDHYTDSNVVHSNKESKNGNNGRNSPSISVVTSVNHNQTKSNHESTSNLEEPLRLSNINFASELNEVFHMVTDDDKMNMNSDSLIKRNTSSFHVNDERKPKLSNSSYSEEKNSSASGNSYSIKKS